MTMPSPSTMSEIEYLSTEIIKDSKPVTYHKLSRHLNIPITKSKQILYEYYLKNKSKLKASFIITGVDDKNTKLIKLSIDESQLEADLSLFKTINVVHVYCLNAKEFDFSTSDIAKEELKYKSKIGSIKNYETNGMIIGPEISQESTETIERIPEESKPIKQEQEPQLPKKEIKSSGLSSGYVSRKASSTKSSLSSHYTSRKKSDSTIPTKRETSNDSSKPLQYKSRKMEQKQPKERIIVDNQNDDDEELEEVQPQAKSATTSDLANMFDDDDDFEFSDDDTKAEIEQSESNPPELANNNSPEDVEMKDDEQEQLFVPEEEEENQEEEQQQHQPIEPEPETTKEVDEDGYITVHRKPNPVTKPQPKRQPPPKKSNKPVNAIKKSDGNNKKKTQTSLMSFFQKK